jgi:hypothetical protein
MPLTLNDRVHVYARAAYNQRGVIIALASHGPATVRLDSGRVIAVAVCDLDVEQNQKEENRKQKAEGPTPAGSLLNRPPSQMPSQHEFAMARMNAAVARMLEARKPVTVPDAMQRR